MNLKKTIFVLAVSAVADELCVVNDGTCMLQLRREGGHEHVTQGVELWKRKMQLLTSGSAGGGRTLFRRGWR